MIPDNNCILFFTTLLIFNVISLTSSTVAGTLELCQSGDTGGTSYNVSSTTVADEEHPSDEKSEYDLALEHLQESETIFSESLQELLVVPSSDDDDAAPHAVPYIATRKSIAVYQKIDCNNA